MQCQCKIGSRVVRTRWWFVIGRSTFEQRTHAREALFQHCCITLFLFLKEANGTLIGQVPVQREECGGGRLLFSAERGIVLIAAVEVYGRGRENACDCTKRMRRIIESAIGVATAAGGVLDHFYECIVSLVVVDHFFFTATFAEEGPR